MKRQRVFPVARQRLESAFVFFYRKALLRAICRAATTKITSKHSIACTVIIWCNHCQPPDSFKALPVQRVSFVYEWTDDRQLSQTERTGLQGMLFLRKVASLCFGRRHCFVEEPRKHSQPCGFSGWQLSEWESERGATGFICILFALNSSYSHIAGLLLFKFHIGNLFWGMGQRSRTQGLLCVFINVFRC